MGNLPKSNTVAGSRKRFYGGLCRRQQAVLNTDVQLNITAVGTQTTCSV